MTIWRASRGGPSSRVNVTLMVRALPSEGKGHTFESCRVCAKRFSSILNFVDTISVTVVSLQFQGGQAHPEKPIQHLKLDPRRRRWVR
jgi:hypothetical protein